jgi:hypothetical protein
MIYVLAVLVAVMVFELWMLYRIAGRLGALGRMEDRLSSLTHTIALLTDTTEGCFNLVAAQLEPAARSGRTRTARQRRVVGAASKGRTISDIAADEELAESEVVLRLALDESPMARKEAGYGALRS